ncbi:MAG: hypothetical protein OEY04_10120, partial [Gammaproteobacteria bacterium]|nr:hypothetical protein [Gammaproteobacteria bacterium]
DPIDKVKAFYDKSIGAMRPLQGEDGKHGFQVYAERAWAEIDTDAGKTNGFIYSGVSVHALAPPPVKGQTPLPATYGEGIPGQEDYLFYSLFKHLGLFHQSVAWYGPEPGKREVADLEAMSRKYGHLESAFFQHKGPELKPVDESLQKRYGDLQGERMQAAMMAPVSARQQLAATAQPAPAGESAEDAEFNRIMQKNPELANRYMSLTQQVGVLMQQGKFDEADELLDEIDELEQSNPELAALADRDQARSDSLSKAGKAQEDAIDAAGSQQLDKALWGTAMEYIEAVDKEDFYTLIVIDNALANYEKDYTRDRALIDGETAAMLHWDSRDWGIHYAQSNVGVVSPASANEPPAEEKKESVTEKAKGFLNKLKKP